MLDGQYIGLVEEFYENGQLKFKGTIKKGKMTEPFERYNEDGVAIV